MIRNGWLRWRPRLRWPGHGSNPSGASHSIEQARRRGGGDCWRHLEENGRTDIGEADLEEG